MKKVYLVLAVFFSLMISFNSSAQDASLTFPINTFTTTTVNPGAYNQVVFQNTGASFSSSTYTNCTGYTSGNTMRVDANADSFDIKTANGTINKIELRIQSNSTTAANAIIAFSSDGGATWTNFQELTLPANNANPSCLYHSVTAPAGAKQFKMMRTGFAGYTPSGTVGQTIRTFEVFVWVNVSSPTITPSVTSLGGFVQTGATPSSSQNYTVSGAGLTGTTVDLAAPSSFQISDDNSNWVTNLSFPVSGGIITGQPKTVYARLNDAVAGPHSGDITHNSTGATQKLVTLTGTTVNTPTITVNPVTLNFGNVFVSSTSAEQSYTVSGVLLTPAADNITITPPANYQVSTSSGTGFTSSISLPYTASTLASTTIYVRLQPTAVTSYAGNITNAGGGAPTANVAVSGAGVLQQIGDFGTVAAGPANWGTAATWLRWDGVGFNTSTGSAPTATDNVWINAGHTVTIEASPKSCKNLIVNGTLQTTTAVNTLRYVQVNGQIVQVNTGGFIGSTTNPTGDLADGIGLASFSPNITINGTGGSIYFSRVQFNLSNSVINVDHDMTVNYHGSTNQGGHTVGLYPNGNFDNCILNINAGKTLTFAPWSVLATTSSTNGLPNLSMTVNVNGTLTMQNSPAPNAGTPTTSSYIYCGVASGKTFTLNVGATGVVNTYQFYPNGTSSNPGTGTGTGPDALVTVASGGQFNISGMADFRKSTQTITGAGTFSLLSGARLKIGSPQGISAFPAVTGQILTATRNYNAGAIYEYDSTAVPQITGDGLPASIAALIINNNTSNVSVTNSFTALDSIRFISGKLVLGANNAIAGAVKNASSTNYVVTDGAGTLGLNIPASTGSYTFPVGYDASTYRPATINFTVAPTAGILSARSIGGFPGNTGLPLTEPAVLPNITDNISLVGDAYWEVNQVSGTGGTYDATFTGNGQVNVLDFANTTLIKRPSSAGSWAIEGTHVATTGSNAAPVLSRTGLTSFSQFGIGAPVGALPLSLISFNASLQNNQVKLFWKTENEINVSQYMIEKSTDARTYNNIGNVAALNGSSNNYNYTDATSLAGVAYYRLKIIDRDGSFKYSNIIAVNNKKPGVLSIFPNPVNSSIFITHDKALAGAKIEVYAMDGRKVMGATATTGATQTSVNAASLPAGQYNLVFANGDNVQYIKFVKQ